jgi:colanic acid/amylovoran biosynthesis protein
MNQEGQTLFFVGNGAYRNRGCEAIARGTVAALERVIDGPINIINAFFPQGGEDTQQQIDRESDSRVTHHSLFSFRTPVNYPRRWTAKWAKRQYAIFKGEHPKRQTQYVKLCQDLPRPQLAMQVGGDNYSVDYGLPYQFLEVDEALISNNIPLILWGCSVGPFTEHPTFEKKIARHLSRFTAIFPREDRTLHYLRSIGVAAPMHRMEDPAFLMPAADPPEQVLKQLEGQDWIGINLAPLIGRYRSRNLYPLWLADAADLIRGLLSKHNYRIVLIPHVTAGWGGSSIVGNESQADELFLATVRSMLSDTERSRTCLLPSDLSASQTKACIGKCQFLIASRTHATIAGFSLGVPTLSVAYSVKARGINEAIFGHTDYCVEAESLTPETLCGKLESVASDSGRIRSTLDSYSRSAQSSVIDAARQVARLIGSSNPD